MENFNELLQKYADFIVRVGVNPQPGQTLIINCPLEGAPLARLCVRSAYEAGARDVQVNWQDDAVTRIRMELGSEEGPTTRAGSCAAIWTTPRARAACACCILLRTTRNCLPGWTALRSAV